MPEAKVELVDVVVTGKRHNRSEDGDRVTYENGDSLKVPASELAKNSDRLTAKSVVVAAEKAKPKKPAKAKGEDKE